MLNNKKTICLSLFIISKKSPPELCPAAYLLVIVTPLISSSNPAIKQRALNLIGEIEFSKKNYGKANVYYRGAAEITSEFTNEQNQALLGKGVSYYYLENYNEAIKSLGKLIESAPQFERNKTNFYLAESNFELGQFQRATTYYNRVNIDDPEVGLQTLFGKAYAYFNAKDYANAIFYFNDY